MASSKYWQEREDDWTKECQANNVQWHQKLQDIYQTMNDEISEQIAVFYQKYADENGLTYAQAKQYLDRTDIRYYSRLAKRYCEDAAKDMAAGTWAHDAAKSYFTQQADQDMKRYNTAMKIARLDMLKRQISLRIANAQRKACSVVEDALNDRILQTYTRQAGILGDTVLTNLKHVSTIAHASFHGATFSDRIWSTQQAKLKKALNKALQDCLILGKGAAPFTRELKKATGKTTRECQRLISTELSRVRVQASLDSFKACGFDEFQIIANPGCCKECQAINGEHFPLPKLASGENAPPMHPNCRCSIAPYEARDEDGDKDFDEAAFDEWCDYMEKHEDDPNAMTWEEWKSRNRGIEQERPMANGARRSNTYILSEKEIEFIKGEAENIGIPLDILSFNEGNVTGVNEVMGLIRIRGDVLPDKSSNNNRDLLSVRAVLAHEYYGHFKHIPSEYPIGDWRDEFRASYEAALNAPNLSDEDRSRLIIDAYERQKEAGEFNGYSEEAKRILFG